MAPGHRSGPLKQVNKKHKTGGHRSKSAVNAAAGGRKVQSVTGCMKRSVIGKAARKSQAKQRRDNKRLAAQKNAYVPWLKLEAPIFVTVFSFVPALPKHEFVDLMCTCDQNASNSRCINGYMNNVVVDRLKTRFTFAAPDVKNIDEVLDCVKTSDVVVMIWPENGEVEAEEEVLISTLLAHGLPTVLHFVPGLGSISAPKQKETIRKNVLKLLKKLSIVSEKLFKCDTADDGLLILRTLMTVKKKPMIMQQLRPFIHAEEFEKTEVEGDLCTLKVSGYLRGKSLDINGLVHLQGIGDFKLEKVVVQDDPLESYELHKDAVMIPKKELQDSLQSEVIPDAMDCEQTWPTEQELNKEALKSKKLLKKVPAGTSAYQATWIVNEDGEEELEEELDESMNGDDMRLVDSDIESNHDDAKSVTSEADNFGDLNDMEIDVTEVEKYRKQRENDQFPDEIDTPLDIPARVRFQRYRALKSFRTSPWDPCENLPPTYGRIFKFADYKHSKKMAMIGTGSGKQYIVPCGTYLSLFIAQVPSSTIDAWRLHAPMVVYGLLPHEHKMSVLNLALRKHPSCTVPILNKQKLIFHVGYRRFTAESIFSQHTNGDKFKMERFMPSNGSFVASVIAPVMFRPASVLVYRRNARNEDQLVASGTVLDVNPDRIILKRTVLSGHPFKINRRHAVLRYMFFNREDIEWFKPVELYTPSGRRGHIKEPLGTHGHMKCVFDQQLNAMDTVLLNLYKRVYPKWSYHELMNPKNSQQKVSKDECDQMDTE